MSNLIVPQPGSNQSAATVRPALKRLIEDALAHAMASSDEDAAAKLCGATPLLTRDEDGEELSESVWIGELGEYGIELSEQETGATASTPTIAPAPSPSAPDSSPVLEKELGGQNGDGPSDQATFQSLLELTAPQSSSTLAFPVAGYVGVIGEIADLIARYYETPKEFIYMDLMTLVGTALSGRFGIKFGDLNPQPRLYVLKVAKSNWSRKTTATTFAEEIILKAIDCGSDDSLASMAEGAPADLELVPGVGSAEGLMGRFRRQEKVGGETRWAGNPRIVLVFDEFRRLEKKARGENAVLLEAIGELYHKNKYSNLTKGQPLYVRNAHLGLISNTTDLNFQELLDGNAMEDIGFLNRIFLVTGESKIRVSWPEAIPREQLDPLIAELGEQFKKLPKVEDDGSCKSPICLKATPEAKWLWKKYYDALPREGEAARLDAMGPRLMTILAFVLGKCEVDVEIVGATLALLKYQHQVRVALRPIVGDDKKARLQARIARQFEKYGPLTKNECYKLAHGERVSIEDFIAAFEQVRVARLEEVGIVTNAAGKKSSKFNILDFSDQVL